jgi:hypothetical protein
MPPDGSGNRSRVSVDDLLVAALASGATLQQAAEAAGVHRRTVSRRNVDPAFRQRVQAMRAEMIGQALGRMADGMTEAADTLRSLLQAEGESVRLGAARAMLELGVKLRDAVELEARIAALEQQASSDLGEAP